MGTRVRVWLGAGMVLVLAVAVGCSPDLDEDSGGAGGAPAPLDGVAVEGYGAVEEGERAADEVLGPIGVLPVVGPSIIKTADLGVEVPRGGFREALRDATALAGRYGGFVLSTSVEGKDARRGALTIRVPSESFEQALSELQGLGEVRRQSVTGEDVSQEFVDLEARLRNLEGQEDVLLRLYDRAGTVADTIKIQREVAGVQLQIEEIQGRLRYLRDRASMSTISVSLVEAGAAPARPGPIGRAWDRAAELFMSTISAVIVGLGAMIPVALLLAVAYVAFRRLRARMPA